LVARVRDELVISVSANTARHGLCTLCLSWSTQQGETPLHQAAVRGHANVCAVLLDRGASLDARNNLVSLAFIRVERSDPCLSV